MKKIFLSIIIFLTVTFFLEANSLNVNIGTTGQSGIESSQSVLENWKFNIPIKSFELEFGNQYTAETVDGYFFALYHYKINSHFFCFDLAGGALLHSSLFFKDAFLFDEHIYLSIKAFFVPAQIYFNISGGCGFNNTYVFGFEKIMNDFYPILRFSLGWQLKQILHIEVYFSSFDYFQFRTYLAPSLGIIFSKQLVSKLTATIEPRINYSSTTAEENMQITSFSFIAGLKYEF